MHRQVAPLQCVTIGFESAYNEAKLGFASPRISKPGNFVTGQLQSVNIFRNTFVDRELRIGVAAIPVQSF